jgi:hypothetical protein
MFSLIALPIGKTGHRLHCTVTCGIRRRTRHALHRRDCPSGSRPRPAQTTGRSAGSGTRAHLTFAQSCPGRHPGRHSDGTILRASARDKSLSGGLPVFGLCCGKAAFPDVGLPASGLSLGKAAFPDAGPPASGLSLGRAAFPDVGLHIPGTPVLSGTSSGSVRRSAGLFH